MRLALVGCGNIAQRYAESIRAEQSLELVGVTDVVAERAAALATELGVTHYPTLDAVLADDGVDTVVNLTAPQAHAEVTAAALEAGKHVHTEKPVALRYEQARDLAELAVRRGVRLSCAPATLLGEAQQTAWKLVREGALGTIRAVYAEANWGRIESWHPSPQSLYAVGPVVDVGVYPLTIVTAIFGPVRRAVAFGATLQPDRVTLDGAAFRLATPDFTVALLELDTSGTSSRTRPPETRPGPGPRVLVRLTATFWVGAGKQRGLELHGDVASLYLASWAEFDSRVELSSDGERFANVPLVREPHSGIGWSRPLVDLAEAIQQGRPHRAGAEHAAHVVEVLDAIAQAAENGGAVNVRSSFDQPMPMDWAR